MSREKAQGLIEAVRDRAAKKGIKAAFSIHIEKSHLMRIGNSSVSLNTSESLTRLDIMVFNGKKSGKHTVMGEIVSEQYVQDALDMAVVKAENSAENEFEVPVPTIKKGIKYSEWYDSSLENLDPQFKADAYRSIIKQVGEGYNYSGSWSSGSVELFLASTESANHQWYLGTDFQFNLVLKHPTKSWELKQTQSGSALKDFSEAKAVEELKMLAGIYETMEPTRLEPGEYRVAFGAEATADIMYMLALTGFDGRIYEEKSGWTTNNKLGDQVLSPRLTILDDPSCAQTFCYPFDLMGEERKPFVWLDKGRLARFSYDANGAAKFKKEPTGHSLESFSIRVEKGTDTDCAVNASEAYGRVIYVPALHYMGLPNPGKGVFTGSSRFNALLIEDGKIIGPIYSSRITDSFASIYNNILRISESTMSVNLSNTYSRRAPVALSVPTLIVCDKVKITDSAKEF
jgi:predicted Zn-dependent protease